MGKTLNSILISYITLVFIFCWCCECDPVANGSSIDGFTTDLIHRDSPDSPLYDPSLTHSQRLANAWQRSLARSRRYTDILQGRKATAQSTLTDAHGAYLMRFFMGSPTKHVLAVVDTGSDVIWTQCLPCKKCKHQLYSIFNPQSSDTYKEIRCGSRSCKAFGSPAFCDMRNEKCIYKMLYEDGSYSQGAVGAETFVFQSSTRGLLNYNNIVFGCGHDNYFHANNAGSGVVGLGVGRASLLTQLGYDKFSYCLMPTGASNKPSILHFGSDAVVSGRGVVSTPLSERNIFYYLTLEAISVGNKRLEFYSPGLVEGGNIVIDSGSFMTLLPINFYDDFEAAIEKSITQKAVRVVGVLRLCYSAPFVMPKITVHFKGADVEWKIENAFVRVKNYVCLSVGPVQGMPIYGNAAQANYLVGYDVRRKTVSFKPTQCGR